MKIAPIIVGTALLIAAVILSLVASNNGEKILAKKNALASEYVSKSDAALKNGDIASALKYGKLAISADPSNQKGFTCYNNAMEKKYKPAVVPTTETTQVPQNPTPQEMPSDAGSSMGC